VLNPLSDWLRQQRLARNWTVAEMGRRLHGAAKATGDHTVPGIAILTSYIRRWEVGKIGITERYRLHYCTALDIPPAQFGLTEPASYLSERAGPVADEVPPGFAAGGSISAPCGGAGNGHRIMERTEQSALPAIALDQLTAAIADESLGFGEWVGMSEVADATIEQYADQARRLARVFEYAMSLPLLLETRRLRDRLASRLRVHQRLDQAREMYLIAAQVCGLLAWMSGDVGNYRAADTHAWTAWMCAEQADHDGARAWVRATQAKLAYWDGRFAESAQLADDGLRYTAADSAHVFLALFQARAFARTGQLSDAAQALANAAARRSAVTAADLLGGVWELTPARYHGLRAGVRLLMDSPADTLAEASQAISLAQAAPPGSRHLYAEMLVRTDQAKAHLQRCELDGAALVLRPVLDLSADMRTEPVVQQLTSLRTSLALPHFADTALARDLQDEIEAYEREALPRQLSA
jgi:hypothetical protein